MRRKINCTGYHADRLSKPHNDDEEVYAALWELRNTEKNSIPALIRQLRSEDGYPAETTEAEERMAATVIQWLGSPVGQGFLEEATVAMKGKN